LNLGKRRVNPGQNLQLNPISPSNSEIYRDRKRNQVPDLSDNTVDGQFYLDMDVSELRGQALNEKPKGIEGGLPPREFSPTRLLEKLCRLCKFLLNGRKLWQSGSHLGLVQFLNSEVQCDDSNNSKLHNSNMNLYCLLQKCVHMQTYMSAWCIFIEQSRSNVASAEPTTLGTNC
jgi:hypothetical protein